MRELIEARGMKQSPLQFQLVISVIAGMFSLHSRRGSSFVRRRLLMSRKLTRWRGDKEVDVRTEPLHVVKAVDAGREVLGDDAVFDEPEQLDGEQELVVSFGLLFDVTLGGDVSGGLVAIRA